MEKKFQIFYYILTILELTYYNFIHLMLTYQNSKIIPHYNNLIIARFTILLQAIFDYQPKRLNKLKLTTIFNNMFRNFSVFIYCKIGLQNRRNYLMKQNNKRIRLVRIFSKVNCKKLNQIKQFLKIKSFAFSTLRILLIDFEHIFNIRKTSSSINMDNTEVNCECSLITVQYRLEKYPSFYQNKQRSESRDSTNSIVKSKISLSRNKSRGGSLHSRAAVSQACSYAKNIRYPSDITYKYSKYPVSSQPIEIKKPRKKYSQLSKNNETAVERQTKDLQQTKNTTLDNSISNSTHHFVRQERMADTISFFGQKRIDEGKLSKKSVPRNGERQYSQNYEANIYSRQQFRNAEDFDRFRRIKTLKQLQFKNAQSSGKMTSQNHMSLALVSDQPHPSELKGLHGLLHKNFSSPYYFSKTQKMVN